MSDSCLFVFSMRPFGVGFSLAPIVLIILLRKFYGPQVWLILIAGPLSSVISVIIIALRHHPIYVMHIDVAFLKTCFKTEVVALTNL